MQLSDLELTLITNHELHHARHVQQHICNPRNLTNTMTLLGLSSTFGDLCTNQLSRIVLRKELASALTASPQFNRAQLPNLIALSE